MRTTYNPTLPRYSTDLVQEGWSTIRLFVRRTVASRRNPEACELRDPQTRSRNLRPDPSLCSIPTLRPSLLQTSRTHPSAPQLPPLSHRLFHTHQCANRCASQLPNATCTQ